MTSTLSHRGPDDAGLWLDPKAGIALGHRRLSILDLSPAGHQPMTSQDGRFVLVLNGEIYNFRELRAELQNSGHAFRSTSDTEVMLAAFSAYGVEEALRRLVGMFAFALWDCQTRTLVLGRDRLGEKPLYYGWANGAFLFASELKAFNGFPDWNGEINPQAMALLLAHKCIPAPLSIYRNIFKLMPGSFLTISKSDLESARTPAPVAYWSLQSTFARGQENPFEGGSADALDKLDHLLRRSIAGQMVADVPVGAFLSGGIDSSTVVALMQSQSVRPVKTFSIGFEQESFDEARHAKAVAEHLVTDHTEVYVQNAELCAIVPDLPRIYDEPFSDTSQIPTVLLCRIARQQVVVSLSGDGGDELFGGYNHYSKTLAVWNAIRMVPGWMRLPFGRILALSSDKFLNTRFAQSPHIAEILNRSCNFSQLIGAPSLSATHDLVRSQCRHPEEWLRTPFAAPSSFTDHFLWDDLASPSRKMMFTDSRSFLPDDILVKVDRAAMNVGLETRIPLLDHRIVEFAARLPLSYLRRDGQGKWLLHQLLYQHVPPRLVNRPKRGFEPPIAHWLAGPLRSWAEELLSEHRLRTAGLFHEGNVRQKWIEQLTGKRNWAQPLWSILMFQAWQDDRRTSLAGPRCHDSDLHVTSVTA
ncbi:MAG: asparagine synthase, glutamine-hydrolyzing [Verrucomicrobiales bacterium]|nr:asparagine synthase, glutamine-hydrolyzing [Verrucomicrobiales bacterium]